MALNVTWTNQPSGDTELLGATSLRPLLDLRGFGQFRFVARIATQGATNSDLRLQGSTDGSSFGNLDGSNGPEIAIGTAGEKDTGWVNISGTYQVDNARLRIMGKDGDGAADPVMSCWVLFR